MAAFLLAHVRPEPVEGQSPSCFDKLNTNGFRRAPNIYSARTFTVLPFTLPADNLRTASRAMSRVTAT